jgi:hypothetical protein
VIRRLDILRIDSLLRLALNIFDFKWRIEGPEGTVLVQVLREIIDFGHEKLLWLIKQAVIGK